MKAGESAIDAKGNVDLAQKRLTATGILRYNGSENFFTVRGSTSSPVFTLQKSRGDRAELDISLPGLQGKVPQQNPSSIFPQHIFPVLDPAPTEP